MIKSASITGTILFALSMTGVVLHGNSDERFAAGKDQQPRVTAKPGASNEIILNVENGYIALEYHLGRKAYTNAGNFKLAADGMLIHSGGFWVPGTKTCRPDIMGLSVSQSGLVRVSYKDGECKELGRLELVSAGDLPFKLLNKTPEGFWIEPVKNPNLSAGIQSLSKRESHE